MEVCTGCSAALKGMGCTIRGLREGCISLWGAGGMGEVSEPARLPVTRPRTEIHAGEFTCAFGDFVVVYGYLGALLCA